MEGELDPFDYMLAEQLGMTVEQMGETLSNAEFVAWRAYHTWKAAQLDFAAKGRE